MIITLFNNNITFSITFFYIIGVKFSTLFYDRKRIAYLKISMMELDTKKSMKREFFLLQQRKLDLFCSLMVCHYLNHLVSQNSQYNFSTYML